MQKLLVSSFLIGSLSAVLSLAGCPGGASEGEGEGSSEGEGEGGAGEGEGEGGAGGEGEGEGGGGCGTGPACSGTQVCTTIFQAGAGGGTQGCYNTCTAGAACTTVTGLAGACAADPAGNNICVSTSALNGPCGDAVNASCDPAVTRLCLQAAGGIGICAKLCSTTDATTCSDPANLGGANNACGCTGAESACSDDLQTAAGDGVCMAPTTVGATCGLDATTQVTTLCTDAQSCNIAQGATAGTCQ